MKVHRHFQTPTSRAIDEVFAWVCTEPDGSEGIIAGSVPNADGSTLALPLVGGDLARMRSYRHIAEQVQRETGYPVRLVRFTTRSVVEEI